MPRRRAAAPRWRVRQYPYEVYVFGKRVNHLRGSRQLSSGERVNLFKTRSYAVVGTWYLNQLCLCQYCAAARHLTSSNSVNRPFKQVLYSFPGKRRLNGLDTVFLTQQWHGQLFRSCRKVTYDFCNLCNKWHDFITNCEWWYVAHVVLFLVRYIPSSILLLSFQDE